MANHNDNLHLVLKQPWYGMIVSGEKREEYREISAYWTTRLLGERGYDETYVKEVVRRIRIQGRAIPENVEQLLKSGNLLALPYKTVTFHKGYTRETASFRVLSIDIRRGRPEWGAVPGRKYFVISFE